MMKYNSTTKNVFQDIENPQTSDPFIKYIILQLVSLIGFINLGLYLKRHF